jgi:hypothetical protein
MPWRGTLRKPRGPSTHPSPVLLQVATQPTAGFNCVLTFERLDLNSHAKRVSYQCSEQYSCHMMSQQMKAVYMAMIPRLHGDKRPVCVRAHTTYIPILPIEDNVENCNNIQEIHSINTTITTSMRQMLTTLVTRKICTM